MLHLTAIVHHGFGERVDHGVDGRGRSVSTEQADDTQPHICRESMGDVEFGDLNKSLGSGDTRIPVIRACRKRFHNGPRRERRGKRASGDTCERC